MSDASPALDEAQLRQRRDRIHAIVEGALLSDIAIVFLLMRVYLPVPVVRTLIRTVAAVPFVMLTQRRGVKITVLAAIASYILFSALVGPLLGLTALDIAVSGILLGVGRRAGLGLGWNVLWTGPTYAFLDLVLPTIATIVLFRYPVKDLVASARNFLHLIFRGLRFVLNELHAPASFLHQVKGWEAAAVADWQVVWLALMVLYGLLNMYLVALVADMVLNQIPDQTLSRQKAA